MEKVRKDINRDTNVKIGLEIHCQLTNLKSKLFCGCSSDYRGKEPNTNICPVCMGLPGSLPVLNKKAVEDAIMIAIALKSDIQRKIIFFRKNYFYPDLPKNYQISQYDKYGGAPIAIGGYLAINNGKVIRIRRIQIEEDPAKLKYEGTIDSSSSTLVDYNRSGIALVEIVTEPDLTSPKEARIFLQKIQSILEHLGVSDSSLEGSMRCDANISIEGGTRVEIKNISSFKEVEKALNFEILRQKRLMEKGFKIIRETRHWDEIRRITVSLRVKEEEEDYRYFPEPDLVPVHIPDELIETIKLNMPELPEDRKNRFVNEYGISSQCAEILVGYKMLADFFECCVRLYPKAKEISNWLAVELLAYLHKHGLELKQLKLMPETFIKLLQLIDQGLISRETAKTIFPEMLTTGADPEEIIKQKNLTKIVDSVYIERIINEVFNKYKNAVIDALKNEKSIHFLVGQVMKATNGRADPSTTLLLIKDKLREISKKTP